MSASTSSQSQPQQPPSNPPAAQAGGQQPPSIGPPSVGVPPTIQPGKNFSSDVKKVMEALGKSQTNIRKLRQVFGRIQSESIHTMKTISQIECVMANINGAYEELELIAGSLPATTPVQPGHPSSLDTFAHFVNDAAADPVISDLFADTVADVQQVHHALAYSTCMNEIMRNMNYRRPPPMVSDPPLPSFDCQGDAVQRKFEMDFENFVRDHNHSATSKKGQPMPRGAQSIPVRHRYLERTEKHCVIEVSFLSADGCKFVILVVSGIIENINYYAQGEEVTTSDDTKRIFDPYRPSAVERYRVLTRFIKQNFNSFKAGMPDPRLQTSYIFRATEKICQSACHPCRYCRQVYRNGAVPTGIDFKTKTAYHEDCHFQAGNTVN